jgi:ureidoglycolate hydrolase
MTTLEVEALTEGAFAPFGEVLRRPPASADATGSGWQWWGEVSHLPNDGRRWAFGYLALGPAPLRIDWAERHLRSPEVIVASSRDIAVYVAPATSGDDGSTRPSLDRFRVFEVPAGSAVILDPGVWHGAPFTMSGPTSAFVLLLEGTGRDDVTVVRFPDEAISVRNGAAGSDRISTQGKG